MAAVIMDGKAVAEKIRKQIKDKVLLMKQKPGLGVVLVGDDPASQIYVNGKEKACNEVGFYSKKILLDKNASQIEIMQVVDEFNQDKNIHGFIVQLPLPVGMDSRLIIDCILPQKDADGLSPVNLGNLLTGGNTIVSATPKGIIRLLEEYNLPIEGKHAVVIGRSNMVGKPIALLLQQKNATVTMCHSKTKDLKRFTKDADIIIAAAGKPNLIKKDMVKKGVVVIDVGTTRLDNGTLCGDVDFENVSKIASYITPVPGGVGPLTIAMLLENTMECYELAKKL